MIWVFSALMLGISASWIWNRSNEAWQSHLNQAYLAGLSIYHALSNPSNLPSNIKMVALESDDAAKAQTGEFASISGISPPALLTQLSIHSNDRTLGGGEVLHLGIVSSDLRYQLAEISSADTQTAPEKLGELTRLLATYCSDPIVFAKLGARPWQRVSADTIWGCAAQPKDMRLLSVALFVLGISILYTQISNTSAHFERFAHALRTRRRLGGPASYLAEGPAELKDIVSSVNTYLEKEREALANRAVVLSGVSHDLGTPATRLRLRAALIQDSELRSKLERDIDQMTGMIESVLTYTRSELSVEQPRPLSLAALVEALVADFQDTGRPVSLEQSTPTTIPAGQAVFATRAGHGALPDERRILVTARPQSLQRAITNLIDNALKYGRRAHVSLTANSTQAVISVEDEGSNLSVSAVEDLLAPFKRGENTERIDGFGLGLTIVATVAEQHGGSLSFSQSQRGLKAELTILRE